MSSTRAPLSELSGRNALAAGAAGGPRKAVAPSAAAAGGITSASLTTSLDGTLSFIADTRKSTTAMLRQMEGQSGFAASLVSVIQNITGEHPASRQLAAATTLKNFIKRRWSKVEAALPSAAEDGDDADDGVVPVASPAVLPETEREPFRQELFNTLLGASVSELRNMVSECFRIVVAHDYPSHWPGVVDLLAAHIELPSATDKENSPRILENVMLATYMLVKQFQFRASASAGMKAVPAGLDSVASKLLSPLVDRILRPLVSRYIRTKTTSAGAGGSVLDENVLGDGSFGAHEFRVMHLALKTVHCATRTFMPAAAEGAVSNLLRDLVSFVRGVITSAAAAEEPCEDDDDFEDDTSSPDAKIVKRTMQIFSTYQTHHRSQFKPIEGDVLAVCLDAMKVTPGKIADRVHAMFLDIVARAADADAGWAVISSGDGLEALIETGILPFLRLRARDIALWEADEDEFVRLHVEPAGVETEDLATFREATFTTRTSAMNLLGVVTTVEVERNAVTEGGKKPRKRVSKSKRRAAGSSASSRKSASASKLPTALSLLQRLLADPTTFTSSRVERVSPSKRRRTGDEESTASDVPQSAAPALYSVLHAYCAVSSAFQALSSTAVAQIVKAGIMPLCSTPPLRSASVPANTAAALCLVSRIAPFMVEATALDFFHRALAFATVSDETTEEDDEISWKPVRKAASIALREIIEHKFTRESLKPHLDALIGQLLAGTKSEGGDDDENTADIPLSLLSLAVCKAEADIAPYAGKMAEALAASCVREASHGADIGESQGLMALDTLLDTINSIDAEEDDCGEEESKGDTPSAVSSDVRAAVVRSTLHLMKSLWVSEENEADVGEQEADESVVAFTPELSSIMSFALAHYEDAKEEDAMAEVLRTFFRQIPLWWNDVAELDTAWDVIIEAGNCAVGMAPTKFAAFQVTKSMLRLGANLIENSAKCGVQAGCRFALAALTCQDAFASASDVEVGPVAQKFVAACGNRLREDCGQSEGCANNAVALVLCACMSRLSSDLLPAVEPSAMLSVVRCISLASASAVSDETAGHARSFYITAVPAFLTAASNGSVPALDSSSARRAVASLFDNAVKQAVYLKEHPDEEEDDEDEEEEEEEGEEGDDEEEDDEDDEAEEEEDEDASESESEDEEAFYQRYADAEKANEGEDEDEEQSPDNGAGELGESVTYNALPEFTSWLSANLDTVSSILKRSSVTAAKKAFL